MFLQPWLTAVRRLLIALALLGLRYWVRVPLPFHLELRYLRSRARHKHKLN